MFEVRAAAAATAVAEAAETGPYQELIAAMDTAVTTGFIDTALGDASDLPFAMSGASDAHCKPPPPPPPQPKPVTKPPPPEAPIDPPLTPDEVRRLTEPMTLPPRSTKDDLMLAPVIIVTRTEVTFGGQLIAPVDAIATDPRALDPLATKLRASAAATKEGLATGGFPPAQVKACEDAEHGRPFQSTICPTGLAILQADETTDMHVINALIHTAKDAGFDNVLFAVKNK